jgi:hypothetical protein
MSLVLDKKHLIKLLNKKSFLHNFTNFIYCIVKQELRSYSGNFPKTPIFLKIFIFWKFFISVWNKAVKSYSKSYVLKFSKYTKNFFLLILNTKINALWKKKKKIKVWNFKNYHNFFSRTYFMDLYLYWNLHFYSNIVVRFYCASFIIWAKLFVPLSDNLEAVKFFLNLKNLYKFKDLYKSIITFSDQNYNFLHLAKYPNYNNFIGVTQKSALLVLSAQYQMLKKKIDQYCLIFDQYDAGCKIVYVNKQKKYTPFFFTMHYEYGARNFIGRNKRRFFFRKSLLLSI